MNTLYIIVVLLATIYLIAARRKNANGSPGRLGFNARNLQKNRGSNTNVTTGARKIGSAQQATSRLSNPYRAVLIISGENPCAAVKAIGIKRFLVEDGDAPQVPLAACDAEKCTCKYGHHEDRRIDDDDRRSISGLKTQLHVGNGNAERREKRGRRESDMD